MTATRNVGGAYVQSLEKRLLFALSPIQYEGPTNVTAQAFSSTSVKLRWTDNSFDEKNYLVLRSTRPLVLEVDIIHRSADVTFYTLPANSTSYIETGLQPSTTYYYAVAAETNSGTFDPFFKPPVVATKVRPDFQTGERIYNEHLGKFDYLVVGEVDDATTPAATFASVDANGTLNIKGTPNDDSIGVSIKLGLMYAKLNGVEMGFDPATVKRISILGFAGDDHIGVISGVAVSAFINGGDGADTLYGAESDDRIDGGNGNDLIKGNDGNDSITGGDGNDTIYGQTGADSIQGNSGQDRLLGGDDNDTMNGGAGNDVLYGQAGVDSLLGGGGRDALIADFG
ncbi:MAG TPA: hypothetical protein VHD56_19310 [Tepidisphaeraceae bacterium]|nr:hypothetical protein [Tepidisphaeraceae bacterium]